MQKVVKRLNIIGNYTIGDNYTAKINEARQLAIEAKQIGETAKQTAEGAVAAVHGNAMTDDVRNNYTINALASEDKAIAEIKQLAETAKQDAATAKQLAEKGIGDAATANQTANSAINKAALVDQKVDKEIGDNNDYHERNDGEWATLQIAVLSPLRELGFLAGE
ncbi:MAG: hypothetical protein RIS64_3780 [Bacteroidota bacterium]|jgi:hypothetical protein